MDWLSFDESVEELLSRIESGARFIGIGGGTGSGKTYLAELIKKRRDIRVIEMDDYYKGRSYVEANLDGNYDVPDAIDIDLLVKNLSELKAGKKTKKPIYDMATSERSGEEEVEPGGSFIINGIFALDDRMADVLDVRVYMDVSRDTMLRRRLERDNAEGRRAVTKNRTEHFDKVVWPMHLKYVAPTRKNADIVIRND